ncbi:MAG: hypothetical protein H0U70_08365 [Tatlockia sp.]|nr:hypothetical protein [Tatlockia sp.]
MVFIVRSFDQIMQGTGNQDGFDTALSTLKAKHIGEKVGIALPQPRRYQVHLIEKTALLLADDVNRDRILTGMILIELCLIAKSYSESIFDAIKSQSKSNYRSSYFPCLCKAIGISANNLPEFEDMERLLGEANEFVNSQIYIDEDPNNGILYDEILGKANHSFAEIEGLDIFNLLTVCTDVLQECAIKKANHQHDKDLKLISQNKDHLNKKIAEFQEAESSKQPGLLSVLANNIYSKSQTLFGRPAVEKEYFQDDDNIESILKNSAQQANEEVDSVDYNSYGTNL